MQKKQMVQFFVLLALILALAGAYAAVRSYNAKQEEKKEQQEAEALVTLTSFEPDSITAISYDFDGEEYAFHNDQGEWKEAGDSETVLDQEKFEEFLKDAGSVTAVRELQEEDGDEDYGFDAPVRTVSVTTENGTSSLIFGMKNEMLGQYYLKTSESSKVYLVEEEVYSVFDKTAEDFEAEEEPADTSTDTDTDIE